MPQKIFDDPNYDYTSNAIRGIAWGCLFMIAMLGLGTLALAALSVLI